MRLVVSKSKTTRYSRLDFLMMNDVGQPLSDRALETKTITDNKCDGKPHTITIIIIIVIMAVVLLLPSSNHRQDDGGRNKDAHPWMWHCRWWWQKQQRRFFLFLLLLVLPILTLTNVWQSSLQVLSASNNMLYYPNEQHEQQQLEGEDADQPTLVERNTKAIDHTTHDLIIVHHENNNVGVATHNIPPSGTATAATETINSNSNSNSNNSTTTTTRGSSSSSATKIIGFADVKYKEIAWRWYQELERLGYDQHMVVAQDRMAAAYFQQQGMRHDWIHAHDLQLLQQKNSIRNSSSSSSSSSAWTNFTSLREDLCTEYDQQWPPGKQNQIYRRSMFGSRWTYILRQLEGDDEGHHAHPVLVTDVDNIFLQYRDLRRELETSPFDMYLAYAGTVRSFPISIYARVGFTICGGMSWLRSTPGIIEIVRELVKQCGCESTLNCHCGCDDQVALNSMLLIDHEPYKIEWDQPPMTFIPVHEAQMSWEGMTGTCKGTGHRVKIWDRHTAFRGHYNPAVCPDEDKSWIAMPTGIEDRANTWTVWSQEGCGNKTISRTPMPNVF